MAFPKFLRWRSGLPLWIERMLAVLVAINVGLVLFDLSYVRLRDLYIRGDLYWQQSQQYRQQEYLQTVDVLAGILKREGLKSPAVEPLLARLRQQSIQLLIRNPPFRLRDRYGVLARIEQQFQQEMGTTSLQQAVEQFWSQESLERKGWRHQLAFFEQQIRPFLYFYEPVLPYDLIKGIEPYRDTQQYLFRVAELKQVLEQEGLQGAAVKPLLRELRDLSTDLMNEGNVGSFVQISGQGGTLVEIKHRIKQHIYGRDPAQHPTLPAPLELPYALGILQFIAPEVLWADKSAKEAFNQFWSQENLSAHSWEAELDFFEQRLQFLMQSLYYRHLGTNDRFVERFWLVDLPWMLWFSLEFLLRIVLMNRFGYSLSPQRQQLSWRDAVKQRWSDLFLLQPWLPQLRIVTAIVRLNQVKFPYLERLSMGLRLSFVTSFAQEMTQAVVSRGINQLQGTVSSGQLKRALFSPGTVPKRVYVDINETNEIQAIANRLWQVTACKVLPEIQPELEEFLQYQANQALQKSSFYRKLQRLPLVRRLPNQIAEKLAMQIAGAIAAGPQKAYQNNQTATPDPIGIALKERLVQRFRQTLRTELQQNHTFDEIEALLIDLLEEVKINYVNPVETQSKIPLQEDDDFQESLANTNAARSTLNPPPRQLEPGDRSEVNTP